MNPRRLSTMLVLLLACASSARADSGTPLMLLTFGQLIILNWLIGLIEAAVIWKTFRVPYARCAGWLIAANYASFLVGWALLLALSSAAEHVRGETILRHGVALLALAFAVSYVITVVLEWPFCRPLAGDGPRAWRRALGISLVAQTVSYALLAPLYVLASPITFVTDARLKPAASFAPATATVLYIGNDNGIWSVNNDGTGRRRLAVNTTVLPAEDLWMEPGKGGRGDLCAMSADQDDHEKYVSRLIVEGLAAPATFAKAMETEGSGNESLTFGGWSFIYPAALPGSLSGGWRVGLDVFAGRGIRISHDGQHAYTLALETPMVTWTPRFATLLPGDRVVFQLGPNIVILDMPTKRLAALAEGRCPLVVLKQPAGRAVR